MTFLADLWLPILLSAVFVFVASSILHMLLPIHKGDWKKLPGEEEILALMRAKGVEPNSYMFPCPKDMKDMQTPEMQAKFQQGPVGFMTIRPSGGTGMGAALVQWFLYALLVSVFVAYVADHVLGAGASYGSVFRLAGTVAFLGYGFASFQDSIWKSQKWGITLKFVFDGLVYALVTAGAFAGFWS